MEYEDMIRETIATLRTAADVYRRDGMPEQADANTALADQWQRRLNEIVDAGDTPLKRLYEQSETEQEQATDEAGTVEELRYVVAFYAGFREAIRRIDPDVDPEASGEVSEAENGKKRTTL